jgi:hypothetical protein
MKKFTDKINESLEEKIPTAEQFTRQTPVLHDMWDNTRGQGQWNQAEINLLLIEFAKLHVKAAVRAQIRIENDRATEQQIDQLTEEALSRTYPLENIK